MGIKQGELRHNGITSSAGGQKRIPATQIKQRTPAGGPPGGGASHFAPIFLPNDLVSVWLLSLLLSMAAGVYPAWKASRLSPLEALRR